MNQIIRRIQIKPRAQAMVEFMLVLPILLLILYGTIEVSRLIFIYTSVANASRQAARYGSTAAESNGVPRYQDCDGIRDVANQSAFIVDFEEINITYDRGLDTHGTQIPISGVDPSPESDSCPIAEYEARNGDRIIVRVSALYEPIVSFVSFEPVDIVSASARTFLISVPILGSAVPTGFHAETSTPSKTLTLTLEFNVPTSTLTLTLPPFGTQPPIVIFPSDTPGSGGATQAPANTPTHTPLPSKTATVTPTAIMCSGLTGVSHGPLVIEQNYMEMAIDNNTGFVLSTSQIYVEWNHDTGHAGSDTTLHLRQVALDDSLWNGDELAPSKFLEGYYPRIPMGSSVIRFIFHQPYDNTDGTERILIMISTPGCLNYPLDSRN